MSEQSENPSRELGFVRNLHVRLDAEGALRYFLWGGGGHEVLGPFGVKWQPSTINEIAIGIEAMLARANVHDPADTVRPRKLRTLGLDLASALLDDELADALELDANSEGSPLLLTLSRSLLHVPWELIYIDGKKTQDFLCRRFQLSRQLEGPQATEPRQQMKSSDSRALVAIGDVKGLKPKREQKDVSRALRRRAFKVTERTGLAAAALRTELHEGFDILHFVGHAEYDQDGSEENGWLCSDGQTLNAANIASLPHAASFPRLIFANACGTAHAGPDRNHTGAGSLYAAFAKHGVQHYIGTVAQVSDRAAAEFAQVFYRSLMAGASIGEALLASRRKFSDKKGTPIWAYYVHYGAPEDRFATPVRFRLPPLPSPVAIPKKLRTAIVSAVALVALCWAVLQIGVPAWEEYSNRFSGESFGIALAAPGLERDVGESSGEALPQLMSDREISAALKGALPSERIEVRSFDIAFRTSEEARLWGLSKNADTVIWPSVTRGQDSVIVRLHAVRLRLPELEHRKEPLKRFLLRMLFPDHFRDDETYTVELILPAVEFSEGDTAGYQKVDNQTAELAGAMRALVLSAQGDYPAAASLLEQIVPRQGTPWLRSWCRELLLLAYLSEGSLEQAKEALVAETFEDELAGEHTVRALFMFAYITRAMTERSFASAANPDGTPRHLPFPPGGAMQKRLLQSATDRSAPGHLRAVAVALLAGGRIGIAEWDKSLRWDATDPVPEELNVGGEVITALVQASPESYFLQYLTGMVSPDRTVGTRALDAAQAIQPDAAPAFYGRALRQRRPGYGLWSTLAELEKAIQKDPMEWDFWLVKLAVIQDLEDRALGRAYDEITRFRISFVRESLAKTSIGDRVRPLLLVRLVLDLILLDDDDGAIDALKVLEEECRERVVFCDVGLRLAMDKLGRREAAEEFIIELMLSSRRGLSAVAEFYLRTEDRQEFLEDAVIRLFGAPPGESFASSNVLGNAAHTWSAMEKAGEYLRDAKRLATHKGPSNWNDQSPLASSPFRASLEDWRWKWATRFDLGLMYLTLRQAAEAVEEFSAAAAVANAVVHTSSTKDFLYIKKLTSVCLATAFNMIGEYEAVERVLWSSFGHAEGRFGFMNETEHQDYLDTLVEDVRQDPYAGMGRAQTIFELTVLLRLYDQGIGFIEEYSLHTRNIDWLGRLLILYARTNNGSGFESTVTAFAGRQGGTSETRNVFANLNSSVHSAWSPIDQIAPTAYHSPDYFWDVINQNP